MEAVNRGEVRESTGRHVWTAPCRQGFFGVSANGSGSGNVYGLEIRPVAAGPDGERGSNSNHCGALLRVMTLSLLYALPIYAVGNSHWLLLSCMDGPLSARLFWCFGKRIGER